MKTFLGEMIAVSGLAMLFGPGTALAQSHTPAKVLNGTATYVKHYEPAQKLRLAIVLTPPHLAEERQFIEDVHNKNSPLFHQFLSNDEWNARFAPAAADEQAVVDWAQSQGLTLTQRYPNRLVVDVEAPAGTIEKAFGVVINNYQVGPDLLYSNDRDPVLPAALTTVVDSVMGLNSIEHVLPNGGAGPYVPGPDYVAGPPIQVADSARADSTRKDASPDAASGPSFGWDPKVLFESQTYNYGALMNQGHCCNPLNHPNNSPPESSIAIAAYGDVSLSDVSNFTAYYSYLTFNVQKLNVDGGYTCSAPGGKPFDNNCLEATMDTEWSLATANSEGSAASTAEVYVYEGPNPLQQSTVDTLNHMLNDGYARVMSTSWGGREATLGLSWMKAVDYIYTEMVGKGWTLVAASGDNGATAGCVDALAVQFPASDPNVVAVGGTGLLGPSAPTYEVAWTGATPAGSCAADQGGSTGGYSAYWGKPSYQAKLTAGSRAVPDMALDASLHVIYLNGAWNTGVGTSVAAPMVAGFFAQENAYLLSLGNKCGSKGTSPCAPLGNANYPMYEVGSNTSRNPFYDIVTGCNTNDITAEYKLTAYCAVPGWDPVTGFGSANMLQLAWAINWQVTTANGIPSVSFSGPPTNAWYNSNQVVNWKVLDFNGGGSAPGTGIAGETYGWGSIPSDPGIEPHGGSGNSFYSGPKIPNASTGCLAFEANGCDGGVSQGCHTVHVEGWNNQGVSTGDSTYGPLCYDTVKPTVSHSLSRSRNANGWFNQPVTVTIHANDPGGSGASGIKTVYYTLGETCGPTSLSSCLIYSGPFAVSQQGYNAVTYFAEDKAGNFSSEQVTGSLNIDTTPPVTTASLAGTLSNGAYDTAVTVTLNVTDNLSHVASTDYSLDGAAMATYSAPIVVASPGTHSLNYYSTDLAGNVETTHTTSFTIVSPTTTTLKSSLNPSVFGHSVTFTASVTAALGATPTGLVTFLDGTTKLGTSLLNVGIATLTTGLLNGTHTITASYAGSSTDRAGKSAILTETVEDTTTTTLVSSPNPSTWFQTVTLTATVTATHGGPVGGTVNFMDGANVGLGSAILNAAGRATFSTVTMSAGTHSLTAVYSGNAGNAASTSPALTQTVNKATTTTVMVSSLNPSVYGQSVTLTATVSTSNFGYVGGPVTFMDGVKAIGTATMDSGNKATLSISTLGAGSHSLTAVFGGNADYTGSTSAALKQTVKQATSTTGLVSMTNPIAFGQAVGLTATVYSEYGGPVSGTVTFMEGTTVLISVSVNPSTNEAGYSITGLLPGSYTYTAVYHGSANDASSKSAAFTQTVKDRSTIMLASSLNPSVFGQTVTLTATVTALHGGPVTGTVTFRDPATLLGLGTVTVDVAGKATLETNKLLPGSHNLTAVYSGSATVEGGDSTVLTQTVRDTSETVLTSSLNPSISGQTVKLTATITLTHGGTVTGTVNFKDGTTTIGTVLIDNAHVATFSTSTLAGGSHTLTAVFAGNAGDAGSTSAALTQVVNQ